MRLVGDRHAASRASLGWIANVGCWLIATASVLAGCERGGAEVEPKTYRAPLLAQAILIDGVLDDPGWREAPWSSEFVEIRGEGFPRPEYSTRVKIAWDQEFLYFGAELEEPDLWAEMKERDSVIWHEDDFEIFIDPDGDRREYYELEINALGTVFDLLLERTYIDGGPAVHEWDVDGLRSATSSRGTINDPSDRDQGWTVEVAWPWTSLAERANRPTPPQPGDRWRMNFSRVDWPLEVVDGRYRKIEGERERNWVFSPQGAINMHLPEHWAFVEFAE